MTRKELVLSALEHKESHPIPFHLEFTKQALDNLVLYTGKPDIEEEFGSCLHYTQHWGWPSAMPGRPGHYQDEFGVVWNRNGADKDIGVVDAPLIEDLENCNYAFPEPDITRLRDDIEEMLATRKDKFTFMGFGFCMFERSWSLMGMENVLMSMIICPEALEALYDQICEYFLRLVDIALEYEIDGIYFGDDWGQQKGLIMGPQHWRRFIKPRMSRLYERVKSRGKYVLQHSCGDCHEIFPDLIDMGLDCYQTFQPEVYDIYEMKRQYGGKLTFWGGVSTQQILPRIDPLGVQAEVVRVVNALHEDGGLIIAPTHAISFDTPPENVLAMAEVFQYQNLFL